MNDQLKQYFEYLQKAGADVPASFDSFKSTLSNEKDAQTYFNYLKENKFDTPDTFDSFYTTFGFKKKDLSAPVSQTGSPSVGQPSQNTSPSQSPLGLVDDISMMPKAEMLGLLNEKKAQYNEFKGEYNKFDKEGDAGNSRKDGVVNQLNTAANDLNYISKTFKDIYGDDKQLEGVDKMTPILKPAEDPRQRISDEFKKGLAEKKKQFYTEQGIPDAENAAVREVNDIYSAIKQSPDYETALKKTSDLRQQVFDVTAGDGESREKLLSKLKQDAFGLGQFLLKDPNAFKNTGGLTPAQKAGLDYIRIFEPERYEALSKRSTVTAETQEQRVGQQINNLELENIGLSMLKTGVSDMFYRVQNRLNQGLVTPDSPEVKNINSWIEYVKKAEDDQLKKYPEALAIRAQQVVNDTDKERLNFADRFSYNFGSAIFGTVDGLVRSAVKRFMGEDDQTRSDLESVMRDSYSYLGSTGQNSASVGRDQITVFSDRLKSEFSKIDEDTKLSRDEKFLKKSELLKSADPSEVYTVINPDASKININAESLLGVLSTVVPQIAGGIVMSAATGGFGNVSKAKQLANIFTTSFASSYGQGYDSDMASGAADADFRAISKAFINGAIEAGVGNDIAQIKKLAGNGVVGKALSKLSDNDWSRIMAGKGVAGGTVKAGKDFVSDVAVEAFGEGLTTAGENIIDGAPVDRGVKETVVSTIIGMGTPRSPIIPFTSRANNMAVKYAFYSGGFNNTQTVSAIKDQIQSGEISEQEGNKRIDVVNKMNGIINTMPMYDKKGNPLSDEAKANYAYNEYIKREAKAAAPNMPSKQAEELKEVAQKADNENGIILDGPQLSKLESGMAVDNTGALTINREGIVNNAKVETDTVKALPIEAESGVTMNLDGTTYTGKGLVVPAASKNVTQEELTPEMLADFVEENKGKLSDGEIFKVGYYKFPNSNQVSIDLNIVADPKNREVALAFGKAAGQESLFDLETKENVKTGADGKNPKQFNDEQFAEIAKSLREGKMPAAVSMENTLITTADTVAKSLEKSEIKFTIIDSSVDGSGAARGNQAIFVSETGEVIIDKSKLKDDIEAGIVVWHEASHPVMNIIRNTDKQLYDSLVRGLKEAAKKDPAIDQALKWAQSQPEYNNEDTQNDEALVETVGRINAGVIDINKLDTGLRQKLIDFVNQIAKYLGLDPILNDTDIAQFKKTISEVADALKTGRDIAEIVGEENVKEYMNKIEAPEAVVGGPYSVQAKVADNAVSVYDSKEVAKIPVRTLEDIYGAFGGKAVVINSDPTRVGELTLPSGKKIFMYGGPGYLSVKDNVDGNVGFATTQMGKVSSWFKYINQVFGDKPGVTIVATQSPLSILSNSYALRYVMDAISMLPKSVLKSSDFKNEFFGKDLVLLKNAFGEKQYTEFVNKYKKQDLSNAEVIDAMIAEMAYKVGDDNKPASFKARGAFVSNLLGGIAKKSDIKTVEGEEGYVSKKPQKFIAKQLMDRLNINTESLVRAIGEPSLIDLFMDKGKWGMAVSGFETDPNVSTESVQSAGVKHPLFNAKFPGKNPFLLDGAYEIDAMFKPVEMTGPSGEPYTKKAAQMLSGSMYVKGMPTEVDGSFEYTKTTPSAGQIQASVGNRIPEAKQKKLTDDGKGNYVFFHYSGKKLSKIDPAKFGSNLATGRDEKPGVGISMFYVDNKTSEPGVPSEFGYAVRVPKEKVYPINEDPLNFFDEAKAQFEADFPGLAFDANKQVGYITKVANENGFDMTITDWNIKGRKALRAQTTEAVKPEVYKKMEFRDGFEREVYTPELEKLKPGIQKSEGNRDLNSKTALVVDSINGGYKKIPISYIRFGEPSVDSKGDIQNSMNFFSGNRESGVSVYKAFYDNNTGKYILLSGSEGYLSTQENISINRKAYLVDGNASGIGRDGELVINKDTFKIVNQVPQSSITTEEDPETNLDGSENDIIPSWDNYQASAGQRTAADFGESADPKTKITLADLGVTAGMSSQGLLDNLINFNGTFTPLLKAIAKKKNLGELKIASLTEITDDPSEAAGGFLSKFTDGVEDRFKGKLYINEEADSQDFGVKNQYYTLTHELMHWVTLDSINTPVNSPAYDKLKDIYNVLSKNADTSPGFGTFETYGLSSFNEFMAELFISAKFRDYVSDVTGSSKDLNDQKDLITILVDYLRDLFAKVFKTEGGTIDPKRPLIDQATEVAKEMFFGNNMQRSAGNRNLAPNGKPSNLNAKQYEQVRTPEFKKWFGDWENDPENASKVIDENGEPLVVYHGTTNSFDEFKTNDLAFFFSNNPDVAGSYTQKVTSGSEPNVIPVFLNIKKMESIDAKGGSFGSIPVTFNSVNITNKGPEYKTGTLSTTEIVRTVLGIRSPKLLSDIKNPDGIVVKNVKDSVLGGLVPSNVYAAFKENQIKSAIGNSGLFSLEDNRIQASPGNRTDADFGRFGPEYSKEFKTAAYVMRSKSDGMSDAEIAMGLLSVSPGMTPQEAKDIIDNPEAYIRSKFSYLSPALQENLINRARVKNIYAKSKTKADPAFDNLEVRESSLDRVEPNKKSKIKKWLGDFKRQWLDAAKGLPEWVLAIKDISSGVKDLQIRQATDMVKDLKKTAESIGFNDWDAFSKAMRSMKRDPETMGAGTAIQPWFANIPGKQLENAPAVIPAEIAALPEEIIPFVYSMRGMIDNLSSELVASGFVTPSQALTLTENLGEYVNRAYKLFNEKGYKPSKESIRDARKFLADGYLKVLADDNAGVLTFDQVEKMALDMADDEIDIIINKKLNPYFKKNDSRDTGVLKERKDIPAPIRKLMGEYTDPGTAFIITVAKQASLKAASQYLTGLRNNGLGKIFFEKDDPKRLKLGYNTEIASQGSESKSPLNGLYTTPEIAQALESVGPTFNDLTNAWMKLVGVVRWGKTVGSVVTQIKNFESNIGFAVMNGLIFSGENTQALKGAGKYFGGQISGKQLDELTQKVMSLGLVNQSVGSGELRKMLGSGDIHDIAVELAVTGKSKGAMNWISKPFKAANKLYQLSDDFWKVYGYLNERELMSNALYNKKYDQLSVDEQTTVDLEASERVKMTQPTYDRVWAGAKYVSERAPIFGNFISFQAEVVRVLNNTIKIAAKDMKSDNPQIKALGYKRFAGMMTYVALRTTLTYAAAQAAGIGVAGLIGMFDDEEEKEKEAGLRKALPPFMRTGDLLAIPQQDPSKFTVFELSSIDPYGIVFKSMNALTEGREGIFSETMDPGVPAAMAEFFSGFLEQEMTFKTFNDLMNNSNPRTGEKIIKNDQTKSQAFLEAGKYVANQLKPSTIGLVERLLGKTPETELGSMFGARPYEVDLNRSFGRVMAQAGKDMEDVVKEYGRARFDKELTPAERKEKVKAAEERLAYYAKNLSETYRQFLLLGADKKTLDEMIKKRGQVKSTGFNKAFKRSILTGEIKPETYFK